jgi:alkanesulfonate monooxygenase SsuD/methylene tetrahydromethanopterin reductase-like flavin-dependent oxidoreductase (luciferase family)
VRPFRFGLQAARVNDPDQWLALARSAEESGYACFMVPDHLGRLSTFPALMAAAAVTREIKLATYVLNQDFRPPGVLAQEAAAVHLLTNGRLELGIGAGWAIHEYTQAGLKYDGAGVRVARFAEYLEVVKGLLNATAPFSYNGSFFTLDSYARCRSTARRRRSWSAAGRRGSSPSRAAWQTSSAFLLARVRTVESTCPISRWQPWRTRCGTFARRPATGSIRSS